MGRDIELRAVIKDLRSVIDDALSPGVFGPYSTVEDPALARTNIREICERHGFGAVMHHVQHIWSEWAKARGLKGSEHTAAACAAVRDDWIEGARKAMERSSAALRAVAGDEGGAK